MTSLHFLSTNSSFPQNSSDTAEFINANNCLFNKPIITTDSATFQFCILDKSVSAETNILLEASTAKEGLFARKNVTIKQSIVKGAVEFKGPHSILDRSSVEKIIGGEDRENKQCIRIHESDVGEIVFHNNMSIIVSGTFSVIHSINGMYKDLHIHVQSPKGIIRVQEEGAPDNESRMSSQAISRGIFLNEELLPITRSIASDQEEAPLTENNQNRIERRWIYLWISDNWAIRIKRTCSVKQSIIFFVDPQLEAILTDIKRRAFQHTNVITDTNIATITFEQNKLAISNSTINEVFSKKNLQEIILNNTQVKMVTFQKGDGKVMLQENSNIATPLIGGEYMHL